MADINGVPVYDGQFVELIKIFTGEMQVYEFLGEWFIYDYAFVLTVKAEDSSGNVTVLMVEPLFENSDPAVGLPGPAVPPRLLPGDEPHPLAPCVAGALSDPFLFLTSCPSC